MAEFTLDQLRAKFPNALTGKSDAESLQWLQNKTGMGMGELAPRFGIDLPDVNSNSGAALSSGWHGYKGAMGDVLAATGQATGLKGLQSYGENVRDINKIQGDYADSLNTDPGSIKDVHSLGDFGGYVRSGALKSLPYMAEAISYAAADGITGGALTPAILERYGAMAAAKYGAKGIAEKVAESGASNYAAKALAKEAATKSAGRGLARTAMMPVVTAPSSIGDVLGNQYTEAGQYDLGSALPAAAVYAGMNAFGIEGSLARGLPTSLLKTRLGRTAVEVGKSAISEGTQEVGQEVMNQAGRMGVNPDATLTSGDAPDRYRESFIMGGLLGGIPSGFHGAFSKSEAAKNADIAQRLANNQQVDVLNGTKAGETAPNPARLIEQGQQLNGEQQVAKLQQIAENYNGVPNAINSALGVDVKAKGKKDTVAAFNEQLPNPVILPDENGKPFSTTDAYHQYLYDHGIPIPAASVNSKNNKAPKAEVAPTEVTPVKQFLTEVGMPKAGPKKQAYATQYLQLVNDGVITREQGDVQFLAALDKGHFAKIDKMFNVATMAKQSEKVSDEQKSAAGWVKNINPQDGSYTWTPPPTQAQQGAKQTREASPEPTVPPPINRDASAKDVQKLRAEAEPKLLAGIGQKYINAMYKLMGKRTADDTGWETIKDDNGEDTDQEMVPLSTREAVSGDDKILSNKTVANHRDLALTQIAANAKAMGISDEAAHMILGIQGEPVADVGPTVKNSAVATAKTEDYNGGDTTTEEFVPEDNSGTKDNFESKTVNDVVIDKDGNEKDVEVPVEDGDVAPVEEGDSYEVDHSLKEKDYENGADVWDEFNNDTVKEGLDDLPWEALTNQERQDFAKIIRAELIASQGQSSLNRIEKLYRGIYDRHLNSRTTTEHSEQTKPRSESADKTTNEIPEGTAQAKEPIVTSRKTIKLAKSDTGTKTAEVKVEGKEKLGTNEEELRKLSDETLASRAKDDGYFPPKMHEDAKAEIARRKSEIRTESQDAQLIKDLNSLATDKNKGAIARGYLEDAKRGKDVRAEAAAWVDAVNGDISFSKANNPKKTIVDEFTKIAHDEFLDFSKEMYEGMFPEEQGEIFTEEYPELNSAPDEHMIVATINGEERRCPAIRIKYNELPIVWSYLTLANNAGLVKGLDNLKGVYVFHESADDFGLGAVQYVDEHDGYLLYLNGRHILGIEGGDLEHTIYHEVAHLEDNAGAYIPTYSSHRRFSNIGILGKELSNAFHADRNPWVRKWFGYPMDDKQFNLNPKQFKKELFAQLMAAYNVPKLRVQLEKHLPLSYIYAEGLTDELQSNDNNPNFISAYSNKASYNELSKNAISTKFNGETHDGAANFSRESRSRTENTSRAERSSSASTTAQETYDKVVDSLPSKAQEPIRYVTDAIKSGLKNALHGAMFTSHLVEKISKIMPSAQTWYDAVNAREVARTKFEAIIDAIADKVDKLDNVSRKKVWTHILEATANQAWGYKPEWKDVAINDKAKADFEALNPEEQALVKEVFKHGADTLKETQRLLDEQLDNTYADKLAKAKTPESKAQLEKEKDKFRKMFGRKLSEMEGPYAPMRRVGSHVVVAKSQAYLDAVATGNKAEQEKMKSDREHFHVEFHDSMAKAKRAKRILETKFAEVEASEKEKTNFEEAMPFQAFEKLRGMIDEKNGKSAEKLSRMINEMYLMTLAETSSRKSEMKRANIAGLNAETIYKAFLSKGKADAHYLSVLQHHKAISNAYGVMRSELHDGAGNKEERSQIFNELTQRYENSFNYEPSPLVGRLMGLNSTWMLLTKPAYYFYNATQPLMMSQPYMAQKYGYGTSMSAIFKAYGELKQMPSFGKFGNMDLEGAPADVKQALVELRNMGRLDIALTQELGARIHSSEFESARKAAGWVTKMRGFAQKVEMTNRIVTASAAYRMAVGEVGHAKAVEYAKDVIDNTHGDYSNFNAPRLMNQNSFARMVTQFRKFQLIQLSLLVREYKNMMQGATLADKWALSKALRYTLAHHAIIAGGLGLPCANLVALAFGAMGDDDDKKDLELSVREAIGDEFTASLLLHGIPSIANINMSGNVGAGQMLSILPYQDIDFSGRDKAASTMVAMAGPLIGGTAMQAADAIKQGGNGEYYKMIMGLAPSGMKSALRAGLEATQGVTNTKGDLTVSPEEITLWDTALKAVGIKTESDSIRQMVQSDKYNFEQFFNDRTHKLKNQYAKAYKDGDGEAMQEIRDHWNAMQGFKRDYGFKAQPISNLLKAPAEQRKREHDTLGGVQFRKQDKGFVQQAVDSED